MKLNELLPPVSLDTMRGILVDRLRERQWPITAWQPGSVGRTLMEVCASVYADLTATIATITAAGFIDYARGPWLTLLASQRYSLERGPATYARHRVRLTSVSSAPSFQINPMLLRFVSTSGRRFIGIGDPVTLEPGGSVDITVQAEFPGSDWNDEPLGEINEMLTPLPGVSCENVEVDSTGTSLVEQGLDEESDESLRERCRDRWPALGESGATAARYRQWAMDSGVGITGVNVSWDGEGAVSLLVSGPEGEVSQEVLDALSAYIEERRPLNVRTDVVSAVNLIVPVRARLFVRSGFAAEVQSSWRSRLSDFGRTLGPGDPLYTSALVAVLMSLPGAVNVTGATENPSPSDDVHPEPNEVVRLDLTDDLEIVEV